MKVLPGGHSVRVDHKQVMPVSVTTGAFAKFAEDPEMAALVAEYCHAVDIWVAPIHVSPLLYIVSQDGREKIPRWTNSYQSLASLRLLFNFLTTVPGLPLLGDPRQVRERLTEAEMGLSRELREKPLTQANFVERMQSSTLKRIHAHEFAIWKLMGLALPVQEVLTPPVEAPAPPKPLYPRSYLLGKQRIRNQKMRENAPSQEEFVERVYFSENPDSWIREYFEFMTKE